MAMYTHVLRAFMMIFHELLDFNVLLNAMVYEMIDQVQACFMKCMFDMLLCNTTTCCKNNELFTNVFFMGVTRFIQAYFNHDL